ncbi:MAG: DHH family phosphoesterase [Anaerolineaceae bacterium]|nr:DHH family phosphoesterase [Anaerolineaceae bacterium]
MLTSIYVIGHLNPDTDSIASAIGYAWLLRERDNVDAIAARAGAINTQSAWVLKKVELESPFLLNDASPRFLSVMRRLDTTTIDKPLKDAWAIASRTGGVAPILAEDGKPYGLINGRSLFRFLSQKVGTHPNQQMQKISDILQMPCHEAAETVVPKFQGSTKIRDVINRILREESDEFFVVDEKSNYLGICRQRDLLHPPRLKLILVDHNEAQQAVSSLDEAELLEVIDHHRLGNPSTHMPIKFFVDIVGSTSTLISERIEEAGLSAPPAIAGIMLAGILADTLILTSPTTTERDHIAAERLGRWAFISGSPLEGQDIQSFGQEVITAGAGLGVRTPSDIVSSDMKTYQAGGYEFAISQAEVSDHREVSKYLETLSNALSDLQESKGLDFTVLMITDVVRGSSRLIIHNSPPLLEELPYAPLADGTRLAEGVVSRKKQLLPAIFGLLED